MNLKLVTSLIAATGVVFSAILSAIISRVNAGRAVKAESIEQQKNKSVQYITDHRIDWIQNVRENMVQFLSIAEDTSWILQGIESDQIIENKVKDSHKKLREHYYGLTLLLNLYYDKDQKIVTQMKKVMDDLPIESDLFDDNKENMFNEDLKTLTSYAQDCLKVEWDKCKRGVYNPSKTSEKYNL